MTGKLKLVRTIPQAPRQAKAWLHELMDEDEKTLVTSTAKEVLEEIEKWEDDEDETKPHPAAPRARTILNARKAKKEVELYDKLLLAGRFHASFSVIGTLTSRMSGGGSAKGIELGGKGSGDGLNPQGIKKATKVRVCFPLADEDMILCGGDFDGFEVSIAEAVYKDANLRQDLLSGKSIHGLFGSVMYKMSYDEVRATDGTDNDLYKRSKGGVFLMFYGGRAWKLSKTLNIEELRAEWGIKEFTENRYPGISRNRELLATKFEALSQPKGIGSKVEYREPEEYIESMLGFKRYFTVENKIRKALFNMAEDMPEELSETKGVIYRTKDRMQTFAGATRSAVIGTAFAIQESIKRVAGNHVIQSPGAEITKKLQWNIWKLQPAGIYHWIVKPMNVHDEVMCPTHPDFTKQVKEQVDLTINEYTHLIPLLGMTWKEGLKSWGDKGENEDEADLEDLGLLEEVDDTTA